LGSNDQQKRCGPRRRMIEPPVVRIRSSPSGPTPIRVGWSEDERVALASAGRALMRLHGFPEDRERIVAPYWFGAPGKPFRRRSGIPFRTAGQGPSPLTSPLSTSRAPSGHVTGRPTSVSWGPTPPSPASSPFSACSIADSVITGLPSPPPSVLSVSHALDGLHSATPSGPISSR